MVPTSLIIPILLVAFITSSWCYFFRNPEKRVMSVYFLMMGGSVGLILLTLGLEIFALNPAWLSWLLLLSSIVWVIASVRLLRQVVAEGRAKAREEERRLMGR
jgi:4-amino-4-deoxy-L-arabinose transferase-like glycosyltransferase